MAPCSERVCGAIWSQTEELRAVNGLYNVTCRSYSLTSEQIPWSQACIPITEGCPMYDSGEWLIRKVYGEIVGLCKQSMASTI